jgi:hypothetical protein
MGIYDGVVDGLVQLVHDVHGQEDLIEDGLLVAVGFGVAPSCGIGDQGYAQAEVNDLLGDCYVQSKEFAELIA